MYKAILLLSSVAALVAADHVFAESHAPRGLVGFTSATTPGDAGILAMTKMCQADFPASRMCNSTEVLATQTVPTLSGDAWVQPTFVPASPIVDASGALATAPAAPGSTNLSCTGWSKALINSVSGDPAYGSVVDSMGRFSVQPCNENRHVACCAGQPELLGDIDGNGKLDLVDVTLLRRYLAGEISTLPG